MKREKKRSKYGYLTAQIDAYKFIQDGYIVHGSDGKGITPYPTITYDGSASAPEGLVYTAESERITYNNSNYRRFNNCDHLIHKVEQMEALTLEFVRTELLSFTEDAVHHCTAHVTENQYFTIRNYSNGLPGLIDSEWATTYDHYLSNKEKRTYALAYLGNRALDAMLPQLDTGFSLPVFLIELVELKGMIASIISCFKNLPAKVIAFARRPLKHMSQSWLAAIFGWLPLVSDVKKIASKLYNIRKTVSSYFENADKRMTLHYQKNLGPTTFQDEGWFGTSETMYWIPQPWEDHARPVANEIAFSIAKTRAITNLKYSATMDFSYSIPCVDDTFNRILAGLDVFGFNPSISDLWEIIPFSFVIDWFVDVGGWLSTFDLSNVPACVCINDFCQSIRYDGKTTMKATLDHVYSNGENDTEHWRVSPVSALPVVTGKAYHRWVGCPSLSRNGIQLKTPKGLQLITAAALIFS